MRPLCLDLFCGRGGWARGFLDAGYRVVGFDIEDESDHYPGEFHQQDLRGWSWTGDMPLVIVASPPCHLLSLANHRPGREERVERGMALVRETIRIIDKIHPPYFAIENVRGAVRAFLPLLGPPKYSDGSWFLWGRFPPWLMPTANRHFKGTGGKNKGGMHTFVSRRGPEAGRIGHNYRTTYGNPAEIAMIPYAISRGLAEACLSMEKTD